MEKIRRVGITGASGFIGKHFVLKFLEDGFHVIAYVRDKRKLDFAKEAGERLQIIEGSMTDREALDSFIKSCDAVVHLAAGTEGAWSDYFDATVRGTELLLSLARENNLRKLVYMSSIGNYDIMKSGQRGTADEDTPLETNLDLRGYYAKSKTLGEREVIKDMDSSPVSITIFRAGLVYARNMKAPLMGCGVRRGNRFINLGMRKKRIPYVHADDLYLAVALALNADQSGIYNAVSDEQPRTRDIIDTYNKYSPRKVKVFYVPYFFFLLNRALDRILPLDTRIGKYNFLLSRTQKNIYYSARKLKKELGWEARVPFDQAMREMAEYHESPVTMGIIGCGFAFKTLHLPVIKGNPRISVKFLYDADFNLADAAQKEFFPQAKIPERIESITKENFPVDFIAILTPPRTHFEIAEKMIKKGFNLLIEKPVTVNYEEAAALDALGKEKRALICIANNYRMRGNVRALLAASRSERNLRDIFVKFWSGPVIQSEGNWRGKFKEALLYEMAYHFIDIALMIGGKLKKIIYKEVGEGEDKTVTGVLATLETNKGLRLRFDLALTPPYAETYIEARGKDKAYRASFYPEKFEVLAGGANPIREMKNNARIILKYALSRVMGRRADSHGELYRLFINSLHDRREEVPVTISDSLPVMEFIKKTLE